MRKVSRGKTKGRSSMSALTATVERHSKDLDSIRAELDALQSIRDEWAIFRQDMTAQMSALRDWLQGFVGRQEIQVRDLERGQRNLLEGQGQIVVVLERIELVLAAKGKAS